MNKKPGDFPLGSILSRAAARAMLGKYPSPEFRKACETLSNEELDALISFASQSQRGDYEPTQEEKAAFDTLEQRLNEFKTTGMLTAKPWGWFGSESSMRDDTRRRQ